MTADFAIRTATIADIAAITHHRVAMFHDMYGLTDAQRDVLTRTSTAFLDDAIPRGDYLGWLAHPATDPATIIAGAGVHRRRVMPFPARSPADEPTIAEGRQGLVVNVYTEAAWRRRGVADRLMQVIIDWAREERLDSLVLHASKFGRSLYERIGFAQTNEMRYMTSLHAPRASPGQRA